MKIELLLLGVACSVTVLAKGGGCAAEMRLIPGVPLLFVDDGVLKERSNLRRIVHEGKPDAQHVLTDTEPWERDERGHGHSNIYGSVYPKEDGSGYRMWYGGRYSRVLVADSTDGVNWTKPILNICDIGGSTSNNVVIPWLASPSILRDTFEKNPERRYKVVGCHYMKPENPKTGYYTMTSPDGIHWKEERQIIRRGCDTCTMSQNPYTGEYLVYHKHEIPELGCNRRVVFLSRSHDFVNWSEPVRVFGADEADDGAWVDNPTQFTDIYNMSVIAHAGGFIGIPSIFRMARYNPNPDKSYAESAHDGPLFLAFATSPDGVSWTRDVGRRAILPNNPRGVYNRSYPGCSSGGPGALLHVGDESWLYTYCGSGLHGTGYRDKIPGVPRCSIGRAVWRRWGFVSLESKGGVCRTRAVRLASNRMTANFKRLDGDGRMKVAAFAQDGKLLATANVAGDGTRQRLDFSRALPVDEPIELQFEITRGALYSVEVE